MKKVIVLTILMIVLTILDNSLMPFIAFKRYFPSLLFIFIISSSIINGKWQALRIGIIAGLLQDLYFFNGFGVNCLTNMITCIIAAKIGESIFKEKKLIPVVSVFALTLLKQSLVFVLLLMVGQKIEAESILYIALYNMIICFFLYKRIYKLCSKNYMKKEWNFKKGD